MLDLCPDCGASWDDPVVSGDEVSCPRCGHTERFRKVPLLVVGGASGVGKSAVLRRLLGTLPGHVLLESDTLWDRRYLPDPGPFYDQWLRLCRDVAQSGLQPVLFGAGFAVPENLVHRPQVRWFSGVEVVALVASDDTLVRRLMARPEERRTEGVEPHVEFSRWLWVNAPARIDAGRPLEAVAADVTSWILDHGGPAPG